MCQLFPISDAVKGLGPLDYEELYGQTFLQPLSPLTDNLMTPSPSGSSCHTPSYATSCVGSIPGSPASPWQTRSFVEGSLATSPLYPSSSSNSPFSNVVSPQHSSANGSPGPSSPLHRSVERQMVRMTIVSSQPPPLIPLNKPTPSSWQPTVIAKPHPTSTVVIAPKQYSPSPAVIAPKQQASPALIIGTKQPKIQSCESASQQPAIKPYPTAHEEMATSLNPQIKEQSMRQVVKSTLEALTLADHDGDT